MRGIGAVKIKRSSKELGVFVPTRKYFRLIHMVLVLIGFHASWTGMHWNIAPRVVAMPHATVAAIKL
jgi:exosortase/archaeosortase